MTTSLQAASRDFKNWFIQDALPLWSSRAICSDTGASYERLLSSGQPDTQCNVRVRVQARQLFVFCLAQELGWMPNTEKLVSHMNEFVQRYGRHHSGHGYVHLLDANNQVIDARQDLYDHAFHLLASLWRYRVFKDDAALEEAENIVHFLDKNFASEHGGWIEGDYAYVCRRQNPHMHLFEAFIAGYEATQDEQWLQRASAMFALFEKHFYDAEQCGLLEYFTDTWQALEGDAGRIIEPGHMMEWVWLLRNYSRLSGENVNAYANALYECALQKGLSEEGLLYDELFLDGSVKKASKRCWPMTELIKASIAQARAGFVQAEDVALSALQVLRARYLAVETPGAYIDQLDADNKVIADVAPASTLYHLIVAAAELNAYTGNA